MHPDDTGTEIARLRKRLERAFADRRYPGDDAIGMTDSRYADYEGHQVAAFHRGRDWRTLTVGQLLDGYAGDVSACLAFMAPDGWRYYLPAYLLMLLDPEEQGYLGDSPLFALTHPRSQMDSWGRVAADLGLELDDVLGQHEALFRERLGGFDDDEIAALRAVLAYLADATDGEHVQLGVTRGTLPNAARIALESWSPDSRR